ncbi:MAG: ATP-binding protein [Ignavibacteria bacterium]|jgi:two-component system phosphate regulon sensor histidine kinase PhoR|nr:ATP-binding protein [Ignavibacteria bacterium]
MKRVSLLTKYSVIFFTVFLLLFVFLSQILDVSNETLFTVSLILIFFYILNAVFLYYEVNSPLKKLFALSDKIKLREDYDDFDHFEKKIYEMNEILDELNNLKSGSMINKEIFQITDELYSVAQRTKFELETAKVFKINRNEFMGNVAHELRTPIFAIQLSLETLLDGAVNDEKVNIDFLNRAFNQTKRLKSLVDDLISISKFETGLKMSKRYFGISNTIVKTIDELKAMAEIKNISLEFDPSIANGVSVFGDEERIKQVLVNLIDNAVKYTANEGFVKLSLDVKEKDVGVRIEDNGIGIPKKDQPRIFERFYRVDKARSRDAGGSGLGLSIVKHILEAHSSSIKVDSEENKGTKFEFSLKR